MILLGCGHLVGLPSKSEKLINLQYLDIVDASRLTEMSRDVSQLKSLQRLTNFIMGQKIRLTIEELREFSDIWQKLHISKMQNGVCNEDAA